jgi:hypothetical protein
LLNALNATVREEGVSKGLPKIETDNTKLQMVKQYQNIDKSLTF